MTETASWLPPGVARRQAQEEAREIREAREAEADREVQAEERHQRALTLYCQQAEQRGEVVTAMQLARRER